MPFVLFTVPPYYSHIQNNYDALSEIFIPIHYFLLHVIRIGTVQE